LNLFFPFLNLFLIVINPRRSEFRTLNLPGAEVSRTSSNSSFTYVRKYGQRRERAEAATIPPARVVLILPLSRSGARPLGAQQKVKRYVHPSVPKLEPREHVRSCPPLLSEPGKGYLPSVLSISGEDHIVLSNARQVHPKEVRRYLGGALRDTLMGGSTSRSSTERIKGRWRPRRFWA